MEMAAGLTIAFSVIFILAGCYVLFRRGWLIEWLVGTAGILLVGISVFMGIFAANILKYDALEKGAPLATVSFEKKSHQEFIVTVTAHSGEKRQYELQGDLWQLDARLLGGKGGLEGMGFKPGFQLEKIQGRYFSLEDERGKKPISHSMVKPSLIYDVWERANESWSLVLKADHSSATYLPMADAAIFKVEMGPTGLISKPVNQAAETALAQWE